METITMMMAMPRSEGETGKDRFAPVVEGFTPTLNPAEWGVRSTECGFGIFTADLASLDRRGIARDFGPGSGLAGSPAGRRRDRVRPGLPARHPLPSWASASLAAPPWPARPQYDAPPGKGIHQKARI